MLSTRLRLDAALYDLTRERQPKQIGRTRKVGKRLTTLKSLLETPQTRPAGAFEQEVTVLARILTPSNVRHPEKPKLGIAVLYCAEGPNNP